MRVRFLLAFVLPVIGLAGLGCETSPPDRELPTMDAVRPRQPVYDQAVRRAKSNSASPRPALRIYKLDMPLQASTSEAWDLVDQNALPAVIGAAWAANGIRLGIMPTHRLDELREALPRIPAVSQAKVFATDQFTPILSTNRLPVPIRVDLTVPPHPVREKVVRSGRLKLLLRGSRGRGASGSSVIVEVVPHQYLPRLSLKPRTQDQKELDGQTFKELSLRVALSSGQCLVVGLDRPWDQTDQSPAPPGQNNNQNQNQPPETNQPDASNAVTFIPSPASRSQSKAGQTEKDADQPAQPNANSNKSDDQANQDALPPIDYHLGRALLTRRRAGHPQQTLLLIRLANR